MNDPFRFFYLSVEALTQVRMSDPTATSSTGGTSPTAASSGRVPVNLEVLPGLHYKMADNLWISGGLVLPINSSSSSQGQQWQVTCSFQF